MSPEQFEEARKTDVRSDIYSFGVMLFQMITGELPFHADTWQEFRRLHQTQDPPRLGEASGLEVVVERCLAKDPPVRYPNFFEARSALAVIYEAIAGREVSVDKPRRHHWAVRRDGADHPRPPPDASTGELTAWQWLNKGASLGHLGRHEEEIECYDRALALSPRDWSAWTNKGLALVELGRHEEAIACYDKALEINPDSKEAWCNKGVALAATAIQRLQTAMSCYDRLLEINPQSVRGWTNKGVALAAVGRLKEAIVCYDNAIAQDGKVAAAWYNKGVALYNPGDFETARDCFKKARELGDEQAELFVRLCRRRLEHNR